MKTTIDPPKTMIAKPALLSPSTSFFWILLAFAAPLPSIDGVAVRASSAFDDATDGDVWTERRFGDTLNAPVRPTSESTRQSTFRTPFTISTRVRDFSIALRLHSIDVT